MTTSLQSYNFNQLSLIDLLEAREMFHAHLINKKNVVATAVGRFLIRYDDLDDSCRAIPPKPGQVKIARTLQNSIVIDSSWPCILVFVEEWQTDKELIESLSTDIVPKTIYMPDGRIIPVCVVEAPKMENEVKTIYLEDLRFPTHMIGGGFPLIVHTQGQDNVATIGCLVSDGHTIYALTNRHVSGQQGQPIETILGTDRTRIGSSSGNSIGKVPFDKMYPGWPGKNIAVNADSGLIEITDVNQWKTSILGIDEIDDLYDLNTMNLNLSLIAEHDIRAGKVIPAANGKVTGYGAVGGLMKGEICALFYRYKSVGGIEYISDFLIGGRDGVPLKTNYGDSGMLWLLESDIETGTKAHQKKTTVYNPVALHWGQHSFYSGRQEGHFAYSLSTSLSNICRELGIEVLRDWNTELDYSWGKVGHYTIGNRAIGAVRNSSLRSFMNKNLENISLKDQYINAGLDQKGGSPQIISDPDKGFCPLADVPDVIWKQAKLSADGKKGTAWGRKGDENPNHYADADAPTKDDGNTLFDRCDSIEKMTVKIWQQYYTDVDLAGIGLDPSQPISRGLVCFRVWQIFDYMVGCTKPEQFIFGAGVLAHYVGDGCQPLHSSYMSDGNPADNKTVMYTPPRGGPVHPKGIPYPRVENPGNGVHVAYEDKMVDDNIADLLSKLDLILKDPGNAISREPVMAIANGQDAAFATLLLMKKTQEDIHPANLVDAYKTAKAGNADISAALYEQFGSKTAGVIARGTRYLAAIWDAAWAARKQTAAFAKPHLIKTDPKNLIKLYRNPKNIPSMSLDTIGKILK